MENEQQQQNNDKPKNTARTVIFKIFDILSWILLGITAVIMIFTIVSRSFADPNKEGKPVFGVTMMIVLSDSMKKTDFAAGDLIFIQTVDPKTLKEGDIICFTSQDRESLGQTITHKIRKKTYVEDTVSVPKTDENGEVVKDANGKTVYETKLVKIPAFTTYGTTSGKDDATPVTYEWIKGKYVGRIPYAGHVTNFLKSPLGYVFVILIPFLALMGYQAFVIIRLIMDANRKKRSANTATLNNERKKLEEERAENLKMLEEMRALKAELDAMRALKAETATSKTEELPKQEEIFEDDNKVVETNDVQTAEEKSEENSEE